MRRHGGKTKDSLVSKEICKGATQTICFLSTVIFAIVEAINLHRLLELLRLAKATCRKFSELLAAVSH